MYGEPAPTFIFKSVVFKWVRCLWLTIRGHFEKGTRETSYHLGLTFWRADTHLAGHDGGGFVRLFRDGRCLTG